MLYLLCPCKHKNTKEGHFNKVMFPPLDTNLGYLLTQTLLLPSLLMPFMKMTPRSHAQQTFSRNVRMNHKAKRI